MKLENKKAFHDYHVLEKMEAGLVLLGPEVKSLRSGDASIKESYARIDNGEIFLHGFRISPYPNSLEKPDPLRRKKLLLHKNEIEHLRRKVEEKGLTIVPILVYFNKGLAKAEIALVKGKNLYDKRNALKKKELDREVQRGIKNRGAK